MGQGDPLEVRLAPLPSAASLPVDRFLQSLLAFHTRTVLTASAADSNNDRQGEDRYRDQRPPVPPGELAEAVPRRRRARLHRLVAQVALHVGRQGAGRLVAAVAVLLQALHHDPVQLPADTAVAAAAARSCGWPRSWPRPAPSVLSRVLGLGGSSSRMMRRISSYPAFLNRSLVERRRAGQQLVQQHAQRVDVAAGVDVEAAHARLLGRHVHRRADHLGEAGEQRLLGQLLARAPWPRRSRSPSRTGVAVVPRDQDVGRLEVAVDDPLLVGVLHRLADRRRTAPAAVAASGGSGRSTR